MFEDKVQDLVLTAHRIEHVGRGGVKTRGGLASLVRWFEAQMIEEADIRKLLRRVEILKVLPT